MKRNFILFFIILSFGLFAWGDYDKDGWHKKTGVNKETGTLFNVQGYSKDGYNKNGFNVEGIHKNGTKYDELGYNKDGYNKNGFNIEGKHENGTKYDINGYDYEGYGADGYNSKGWSKSKDNKINKFTKTEYDASGLNIDGRYQNGLLFDYKEKNKETIDKFKNTVFINNNRDISKSYINFIKKYNENLYAIEELILLKERDAIFSDYKAIANKNSRIIAIESDNSIIKLNLNLEIREKSSYFDFYVFDNKDINKVGIICVLDFISKKIDFPKYIYFLNDKGIRFSIGITDIPTTTRIDKNLELFENKVQFEIENAKDFSKLFDSREVEVLVGTSEGEFKSKLNNAEIEKMREIIFFYKTRQNN